MASRSRFDLGGAPWKEDSSTILEGSVEGSYSRAQGPVGVFIIGEGTWVLAAKRWAGPPRVFNLRQTNLRSQSGDFFDGVGRSSPPSKKPFSMATLELCSKNHTCVEKLPENCAISAEIGTFGHDTSQN